MPHVIDEGYDAAWKTHLRDRITNNLDDMVRDATEAYQQRIADNESAPIEVLYRFQSEYNRDVQNLQRSAEEQITAEIAREERERKWGAEESWPLAGDVTQELVEEQLSILHTIKNTSPHVQRVGVEEYTTASFQQRSSTLPLDPRHTSARERSSSNAGYDLHDYHIPVPVQAPRAETPADREARARAEKYQRQQEEFRKRAEAIQRRKQEERQLNNELNWTETMSSSSSHTSASDQEVLAASETVFKAEHPMSEEDVENLVIFHHQQWTWILTLPHVQWADFPWPLLSFSSPRRVEDLTLEAVAEYVFAPLTIHQDRALVKDRLKDLIRRWHPDRFEIKYLARVADLHEREMVREGAGIVARILNDLLGKWNDL